MSEANMTAATVLAPTAPLPAAEEIRYDTSPPERRAEIDEAIKEISIDDSTSVLFFGTAAQDAVNVRSRFTYCLQLVNSIGDQATALDIKTERVHRRQLHFVGNINKHVSFRRRERARCYDQSAIWLLSEVFQHPLDIRSVASSQPSDAHA